MSALICSLFKKPIATGHGICSLAQQARLSQRESGDLNSGRSGTDVYGRYCRVDGCFYL